MNTYLAGPMTGHPHHNYPAFHTAANQLRATGKTVTNPAELFDGNHNLPHTTYIREGLRHLLDCNELVALPGWQHSPGAQLEIAVAQAIGLPITELAADHTNPA
jgi:hypothetical protein